MANIRHHLLVLLALLLAATTLPACEQQDYSNPEYLSKRIRAGDERALREAARLESAEDRASLVPALIDAYNDNLRRSEVVRLLVDIGHPDGAPVLLSVLSGNDNLLAGQAARGIARAGLTENASDIVSRMQRVQNPQDWEPFMDALRIMPGNEAAATAVSEIIQRPAGQIGGVPTVRMGCEIIGKSGTSNPAAIQGAIFGLVNFQPSPWADATNECLLALVQIGEPAVEGLMEVFRGENDAVTAHVASLGYTNAVAALRAARAIADIRSEAALQPMLDWFNNPPQVTEQQLQDWGLERAQNWFSNFKTQIRVAAEYLEHMAQPGDNPAHNLLKGLAFGGEGSPLGGFENF
ncbi:MAG: HEAT repeat domain-containing protein, partial [Myxococcales bacterium]|nr:HEAT repeat domain-containing protein [Myxococcales bacterium]